MKCQCLFSGQKQKKYFKMSSADAKLQPLPLSDSVDNKLMIFF